MLLPSVFLMLKTSLSFEVARRHKNHSFLRESIYHISYQHLLYRKTWRFSEFFRIAEPWNCHKQRCLQNHNNGGLPHTPAHIQSFAVSWIISHFFLLPCQYRRKLSPAQNEFLHPLLHQWDIWSWLLQVSCDSALWDSCWNTSCNIWKCFIAI